MDTKGIIQKDNQYLKVYNDTYRKKMDYLVKVITEYQTGQENFVVLNFEAGLGKSFTVDMTLQHLMLFDFEKEFIDKKFIIVKRFNDESENSEKLINNSFIEKAVAITHKNWTSWLCKLDELQEKRVIIISHQRYISLSENDELRQIFCEGRDTLIIDEKVNFPVYTYNDIRYTKIFGMIPNGLRDQLVNVCKPLNDFIELQKSLGHTNKVFTHKFKIHTSTLENFINDIKIALRNDTVKEIDKRTAIINFIHDLKLFYSSQSIYNSGNISTYNPKHKHWGLENNIILDASGEIDGAYACNSQKFLVINQSRIIDHRDSKFHIIKFNSSKSNILAHQEKYFNEISKKIIENKKDTDKVLIVGHKDFADKLHSKLIDLHNENDIWIDKRDKNNDPDYNNQSIAISWFGNLIGKNWAGDFTQVWLISTPNIPLEHYLIHFLQYSDDKIGNKSTDVVKGRFKNGYFKMIQEGYIAAEMYQSLKRIQRIPKPKGDFFIVSKDQKIVNMILSQVKGANNIKEIELDFVTEKKQKKEPDQVEQFIAFLLNNEKGLYKKSEVANRLKITKLNRVLSDTRVKTLLNKRVKIHARTIEIL